MIRFFVLGVFLGFAVFGFTMACAALYAAWGARSRRDASASPSPRVVGGGEPARSSLPAPAPGSNLTDFDEWQARVQRSRGQHPTGPSAA